MGLADALSKKGLVNSSTATVTQFVSTGYPPLDKRLSGSYHNGGFPCGRIVEVFGPPSAGKTAISTATMGNAQKVGGVGDFQDHENSFDADLGRERLGLSLDPDHWVYNTPDTFEESVDQVQTMLETARGLEFKGGKFVQTGEALVPMEKPIVVVFDSLASMVPQSAFTDSKGKAKEAADRNMNDNTALARATSAHFPRINLLAQRANALIIFLNQVRTKLGVMYGDPTTTPGGGAPEYYASVRLKLGRSILTQGEGSAKKIVGQRIGCETVKNKVSAPFQKCEWDFLFQPDGTGKFDVVGGVIDELKMLGILETAGAYIVWEGKKLYKSQLVEKIEAEGDEGVARLIAMLP